MAREQNPTYRLKKLKTAITGLKKRLPAGITTLKFKGRDIPIEDVLATLREYRDIYDAVPEAERLLETKLDRRRRADPEIDDFMEGLRAALAPIFGDYNPAMLNFGFRPRKRRRKMTVREMVARNEKALATRKERRTMGKRQKKALKASARAQTAE